MNQKMKSRHYRDFLELLCFPEFLDLNINVFNRAQKHHHTDDDEERVIK